MITKIFLHLSFLSSLEASRITRQKEPKLVLEYIPATLTLCITKQLRIGRMLPSGIAGSLLHPKPQLSSRCTCSGTVGRLVLLSSGSFPSAGDTQPQNVMTCCSRGANRLLTLQFTGSFDCFLCESSLHSNLCLRHCGY